ncbi:DsbA family protein [Streptomyces profundus]|uniref:DsbA family protein n=1 Tax=Streptomyces profundus TaxID=2867410 RepID=UPI001D15FB27|nr:DsbA family protein [Streptomyces sp. MA3_2.13]UED83062.1 DsbA family protein [Streptomyces sp. MA3_2.13]
MNETNGTAVLDVWCDLQCPDCHRAEDDLRALAERFGAALEIRRRHFPLPGHRHALAAAQAAEEAYAQGKGDAYWTAVLARTGAVAKRGEAELLAVAREIGLDTDEVETALIDGRHLLAVDADHAEGQALGVTGTPTYLIDGERLDGGKSQAGLRERIVEIVERLLAERA